jgi:type II secretory pathway pseudopilin PulG
MKKTLKGFTLIELGIVIFSFSVLTGIIVPNLQRYIEEAEIASDYANGALIYNDVSLVISSDDDAYFSFYAMEYDGTKKDSKECQYPQAKMVKDKDGNYIQTWTKDTHYVTTVVTRCSGADYSTMMALAKRQGQGYDKQKENQGLTGNTNNNSNWHGLHDHFNDGSSVLFTWEPVLANKSMDREDIMKKVRENKFGWGDGKDSHKYFTLLLCEKENLPIWSDYVNGTKSLNKKVTSKPAIQMRYYKGNKNPDKGKDSAGVQYLFSQSDYVWEWMITYNPDTLEPEVWAGNGQGNLVRRLYPDVDSDTVLNDW